MSSNNPQYKLLCISDGEYVSWKRLYNGHNGPIYRVYIPFLNIDKQLLKGYLYGEPNDCTTSMTNSYRKIVYIKNYILKEAKKIIHLSITEHDFEIIRIK